jgi:hypothetical protein
MKPGVEFGAILKRCFEAQLDGVFSDHAGGMEYLRVESVRYYGKLQ